MECALRTYSLQQNMFNYTRFNNTRYFKVTSYLNSVQESLNLCVQSCKLKAANTNTQPSRQVKNNAKTIN